MTKYISPADWDSSDENVDEIKIGDVVVLIYKKEKKIIYSSKEVIVEEYDYDELEEYIKEYEKLIGVFKMCIHKFENDKAK